jgi:hypothetical protein
MVQVQLGKVRLRVGAKVVEVDAAGWAVGLAQVRAEIAFV